MFKSHNSDAPSPHSHQKDRLFWLVVSALIIIIIAAVIIWYIILSNRSKQVTHNAVLVVLATAVKSDVPMNIPALGSVIPTYSVTVRTQINGILMQVFYREGQLVKAGDLLAQIDERPYLAQLSQYEGALARDQAFLANARIDLKRYQKLYPTGAISQQIYETQQSLVKQYEGIVKFDLGQIETVKVNLIYTKIISPIDGQVGLRLVDPGNFVQTTNTNGLAVINTISPITVIFSIPEDNVPAVLKQINSGKTLSVSAYDRSQNNLIETGTLLTMDNQIDPTTGTVKLRAQFKNDPYVLFPNQFVNIELLVDTLHNAIVVPTAAVQHSAKGTFVYLVNANHTVSVKPVVVGITNNDKTVITQGVAENDLVVEEGADKLTDGATITVTGAK
jgi:multidrug efflux system membrane fusion protein